MASLPVVDDALRAALVRDYGVPAGVAERVTPEDAARVLATTPGSPAAIGAVSMVISARRTPAVSADAGTVQTGAPAAAPEDPFDIGPLTPEELAALPPVDAEAPAPDNLPPLSPEQQAEEDAMRRAWEAEQLAEVRDFQNANGTPLDRAILSLGGLPLPESPQAGAHRGELERLRTEVIEAARAARRTDRGAPSIKQAVARVFSPDALNPDHLLASLTSAGFEVGSLADVADLYGHGLRTGQHAIGYQQSAEDSGRLREDGGKIEDVLKAGQVPRAGGQIRVQFHQVTAGEAERISAAANVDTVGAYHVMDDDFVRKVLKDHGDPTEEIARGNLPITLADLSRVPSIVANFDAVTATEKNNVKGLLFEKRENGTVYYVATGPNKNGRILAKTMWKKPSRPQQSPEFPVPPLTSEPLPGMTSSGGNVTETPGSVNPSLTPGVARQMLIPYGDAGAVYGKSVASESAPAAAAPGEILGRLKTATSEELQAALTAGKGTVSSILAGAAAREIPAWNINGAKIETPRDFALTVQAIRSPHQEMLKVAVLNARNKVVHSQIIAVGTINETVAAPRDIMAALSLTAKKTTERRITDC